MTESPDKEGMGEGSFTESKDGSMDLATTTSQSNYVANEFVTSEASYRASLNVLWKAFILPMFNSQSNSEKMMKNFGADLFSIIACHQLIENQLQDCEASQFPKLLLKMAPSLQQAYMNYIINFGQNSMDLENARREISGEVWDTGMTQMAEAMKKDDPLLKDTDISFNSLVAMPMQRLVRYSLLCTEFVKMLETEDSDEIKTATKAADAIQQMCSAVNESKQMMVNTRKLLEIERDYSLYGIAEDPRRKLINEGPFVRADIKGGANRLRNCHVLLFNDKLCIIKFKDEMKTVVKRIDELPLRCVQSVRNLHSDSSHKFNMSLRGILLTHSDPYKESDVEHQLLLLDDDDLNIGIWIKDITFAVDARLHGEK